MEKYQPKPIDTSHITLPKGILKLKEKLAENVHDVWAQQRIKDGWTYGKRRSDRTKRHPCLVPYRELPVSEKRYDRSTMEETIKCILALGYTLDSAKHDAEEDDPALRELELLLKSPKPDFLEMFRLWQNRNPLARPETPRLHELFANRLIKMEESIVAYDVIAHGLSIWPSDKSMLHKKGLVLARTGATEEALSIASGLERVTGKKDPLHDEILGLLGRCYKDLWEYEHDSTRKREHLERAFEFYQRAFQSLRGTYYTGINAAHMALLKGDREEALRLAEMVISCCASERRKGEDSYWLYATMGHALLIKAFQEPRFMDEAEHWLRSAATAGAGNYGDLNATKRSIRQIRENITLPREFEERVESLLALFQCPCVAVFSGHMIDQPGRPEPRFPQGIAARVKREIKQKLMDLNVRIGFASGACGADILFHETLLELGGETHVVLPFNRDEFMKTTVGVGENADFWKGKLRAILKKAKSVITVSRQQTDFGSVYYDYANIVLNGLSRNQAMHLDTDLVALTVWNGKAGDGPGGTASMYGYWKDVMGLPNIQVINPRQFLPEGEVGNLTGADISPDDMTIEPANAQSPVASPVAAESIKAMLFADVVKFSSLKAGQIPAFVKSFMGAIAGLIEKTEYKPETRNTWGDGLYFVFDKVEHAGLFALDLCDLVLGTNWMEKGLNDNTSIRIALHAGPVFCCVDPILGVKNYTGYHVNTAARLEPITPPGNVYATQQFAALASFHGITGFACDYVGQIPFPKGFGAYPIYHVRRAQG